MEGWRQYVARKCGVRVLSSSVRYDQRADSTFLPGGRVAERSSSSRDRWRRTKRALDGCGPLGKASARKKGGA
jgi:hypothetical protein